MTTPSDALAANVFSSACTSRTTLQHLTGRWGALVVGALKMAEDPMRFGAIRRRVEGISDRMLSQTLTNLERDGIVTRTVLSTIPPNVEYSLTELGTTIAQPLLSLISLLEAEFPRVAEAQQQFDQNNAP